MSDGLRSFMAWKLALIALAWDAVATQLGDTDEAYDTDLGLLQKSLQINSQESNSETHSSLVHKLWGFTERVLDSSGQWNAAGDDPDCEDDDMTPECRRARRRARRKARRDARRARRRERQKERAARRAARIEERKEKRKARREERKEKRKANRKARKEAKRLEKWKEVQDDRAAVEREKLGNDPSEVFKYRRITKEGSRAMVLEGYGRTANACHTALFGSMLNVLTRLKKEGTMESNFLDLFKSIETFASDGAGAVQVAMMAYARNFSDRIVRMAETPNEAGAIYTDDLFTVQGMKEFMDKDEISSLEKVRSIFKNTVKIDGEVRKGNYSLVQPFMKDKNWLTSISIATGTKDAPVRVSDNLTYYLTSPDGPLPDKMIPGVLSIKFGKNMLREISPMDVTPVSLERNHNGGCEEDDQDIEPNTDFKYPGGIRLVSAVAVSNMHEGPLIMGSQLEQTKWSMWAVPDKSDWTSDPLMKGEQTVLLKQFDQSNRCKAYGMFAGSFTDKAGIAQAIASGASKITISTQGFGAIHFLNTLGNKGCPFTIFETNPYHTFRGMDSNGTVNRPHFARLMYSPSWIWTRIALEQANFNTTNNSWFGIPAQLNITLNVINIRTAGDAITAAQFNRNIAGAQFFGSLVQAVVDTLSHKINQEPACFMLSRFFGALDEKKCEEHKESMVTCLVHPFGCMWSMYNRLTDKDLYTEEDLDHMANSEECKPQAQAEQSSTWSAGNGNDALKKMMKIK